MGMPLVMLEMGYGQFSSLSPIAVWKMAPLFEGVGFGMVIISAVVCVYYNVIIAWTIYYFALSFSWKLPWSTCGNSWNTDYCYTRSNSSNITQSNYTNITDRANVTLNNTRSPSEEFFERYVLGMSDGIDNLGTLRWQLVVSLLAAWIFIFLALCKGVKSSGKVVYVTATLPYILIFAFLIRAVTLDGSYEGIKRYILPVWGQLITFEVCVILQCCILPPQFWHKTRGQLNVGGFKYYVDPILLPRCTFLKVNISNGLDLSCQHSEMHHLCVIYCTV